jgi:hypothetical protein
MNKTYVVVATVNFEIVNVYIGSDKIEAIAVKKRYYTATIEVWVNGKKTNEYVS